MADFLFLALAAVLYVGVSIFLEWALRPLGPAITRRPRLGKVIAVMFSLLVLGLLVTMLVWAITPDQHADGFTPSRLVSDG